MIDDDSSLGGGFGRIGCRSTMFGCNWRLFGQVIRFNMRFSDVIGISLSQRFRSGSSFTVHVVQRLMALKKAYADIILNTEKEVAKRIMVSERKAVRLEYELKVAKEDAVQVLMRVKQMMDCRVWVKGVLKFWIMISGVELDEFQTFKYYIFR
ncbi:hypothetical protein Hanom_Chr08g00704461 [Helianthus anomalus]